MKRGDVYDVRLDPTEGSEQGGIRPVVIVSRDVINDRSSVVLAIPFTTYRSGKRVYPTQVLIVAPEGGLDQESIAMADQVRVLAKSIVGRLSYQRIGILYCLKTESALTQVKFSAML
jgi:mRNA interferase MazF